MAQAYSRIPSSAPVHVQLPSQVGVAGAGSPLSNLFTLPTTHEAQAFAVAVRQHYGNGTGFGGGGPLPAHNIIQFSTAGVGFQFW